MKIALVFPSFADPSPRSIGLRLAGALAARGEEVSLIVLATGAPPPGNGRGFRLRHCPLSGVSGAASRLRKILQEEGADLVHLHLFGCQRRYWRAVPRALPPGLPLLATLQDDLPLIAQDPGLPLLWRRADRLTTLSRALRGRLRRLPALRRRRIDVVYNGADRSPGTPAVPGTGRYILSVSRLDFDHGADVLLMAYAGARARAGRLPPLWLLGPDHSEGRVASFARRLGLGADVRLLGAKPPAQARRLIEGALFCAGAQRSERGYVALLEGMAAGKALLAPALPGVREVARHGSEAWLSRPGRPESLARGLLALSRDAALRGRLGRGGLRRAQGFGWDRAAAAYARAYRELGHG